MPPLSSGASLRSSSVPPRPPSVPPRPSSPPAEGARVVALPDDIRALDVADTARDAMLALLRGIGEGWGKRDVAQWLAVPYAALTAFAEQPDDDEIEDSDTFRRLPTRVAPERLDEVLRAAKEETLATLILAAPPGSDVRFTTRAVGAGHVVRTRDVTGRGGWAPVDARGMLLVDRILSLASVDYLMRPADYLGRLSVCGICQAVSFDAQVRVRGHCPQHRRSSGKIPVSRR
jgi:hypothetical protein